MSAASKMVTAFCEANGICVRCKCEFVKAAGGKLCPKCVAYILTLPSGTAKRLRLYFIGR
jgi:hypothetical protein